MTLKEFLTQNPVDGIKEEIVLSERLCDYRFVIMAATAGEIEKYRRLCRHGGYLDGEKFRKMLIINHCVEPDFKDVAFMEAAGALTADDLVDKLLKAGEIDRLAKRIYALSGFDKSIKQLVGEAKN